MRDLLLTFMEDTKDIARLLLSNTLVSKIKRDIELACAILECGGLAEHLEPTLDLLLQHYSSPQGKSRILSALCGNPSALDMIRDNAPGFDLHCWQRLCSNQSPALCSFLHENVDRFDDVCWKNLLLNPAMVDLLDQHLTLTMIYIGRFSRRILPHLEGSCLSECGSLTPLVILNYIYSRAGKSLPPVAGHTLESVLTKKITLLTLTDWKIIATSANMDEFLMRHHERFAMTLRGTFFPTIIAHPNSPLVVIDMFKLSVDELYTIFTTNSCPEFVDQTEKKYHFATWQSIASNDFWLAVLKNPGAQSMLKKYSCVWNREDSRQDTRVWDSLASNPSPQALAILAENSTHWMCLGRVWKWIELYPYNAHFFLQYTNCALLENLVDTFYDPKRLSLQRDQTVKSVSHIKKMWDLLATKISACPQKNWVPQICRQVAHNIWVEIHENPKSAYLSRKPGYEEILAFATGLETVPKQSTCPCLETLPEQSDTQYVSFILETFP